MAAIVEVDGFTEEIYQLETADPVLAGPDGKANIQAKQLGGRTRWLRDRMKSALRVSQIKKIVESYTISAEDIGSIVAINNTNFTVRLPALANFPKYQPFTVMYGNQTNQVSFTLLTTAGDKVREHPQDGTNEAFLKMRPGKRVTIMATDDEWLIVDAFDKNTEPVASYHEFASTGDREGYLYCDGRTVSRTKYKDLFDSIGTIYGSGDGVNTFEIPDRRGVFARGLDDGRMLDFGRTLGSLQGDMFKAHAHKQGSEALYDFYHDNAADPETPNGDIIGPRNFQTGGTIYSYIKALTQKVGGTETRPKNISVCVFIKT